MAEPITPPVTGSDRPTGALVLVDGTVLLGQGFGAEGMAVGEVCFNTAMTGYQEILTDPSYAGQIITFTFPHIGNVGTNPEDLETTNPAARGLVVRAEITEPSNWRASQDLRAWLKHRGLVGLAGIDTRRLTRRIRDLGAPTGVIVHASSGALELESARAFAASWPGLDGMDLAKDVTVRQTRRWDETRWALGTGYGRLQAPCRRVVAIDYGAKHNILRSLADTGSAVTVVPADASAEEILRHDPEGVFLSNGPGDPAATGVYAVPVIRTLLETGLPIFGICLGHQLLALALGAKTRKMALGHRGANHPVKDLETGAVEITSQNHGFVVDGATLPADAVETHVSLFDRSNEGFRLKDRPVFAVQYHPEASPGPHDAHHLFRRFAQAIDDRRKR